MPSSRKADSLSAFKLPFCFQAIVENCLTRGASTMHQPQNNNEQGALLQVLWRSQLHTCSTVNKKASRKSCASFSGQLAISRKWRHSPAHYQRLSQHIWQQG
jgi:hypothetical protein